MHCSFNCSHVESLSNPTESEYKTNDEYDHNRRVVHDEKISIREVAQLSGLKHEIHWSQNTRKVSIIPHVKTPNQNDVKQQVEQSDNIDIKKDLLSNE